MKTGHVFHTLCAAVVFGLSTLTYHADAVTGETDGATQKETGGGKEEELSVVAAALKGKEFLLPVRVNTKAKVYFIYQSRSVCGICAAEAPAIVKIYKAMHGKGAELVMLNVDADREAAVKWAKKEKMKFPIVPFGSAAGIPFPYEGDDLLPCMVAVDADGNKLGEANAGNVPEFLKGWKKMVREAGKASKTDAPSKKGSESKHTEEE